MSVTKAETLMLAELQRLKMGAGYIKGIKRVFQPPLAHHLFRVSFKGRARRFLITFNEEAETYTAPREVTNSERKKIGESAGRARHAAHVAERRNKHRENKKKERDEKGYYSLTLKHPETGDPLITVRTQLNEANKTIFIGWEGVGCEVIFGEVAQANKMVILKWIEPTTEG